MTARNHHFVSQCYLRGFTHGGTRQSTFEVFDRERSKQYTQRPRKVGYEYDFNTVDIAGLTPDALEQAIANFEGEFSKSLKRIIEAGNLDNEEDRVYLLNFISMLAVRNPRMRKMLVGMKEQTMRIMAEAMVSSKQMYESQIAGATAAGYVEPDHDVTYEQMKDFVKRGEYDIVVPREDSILREFDAQPAVLECLIDRKWSIIRAHGNTGFVSSDHPVCLHWQKPPPPSIFNSPGFGLTGTDVIFPISKSLLAVGRFEGNAEVIDANQRTTAHLNSIVASHASTQIYAADGQPLFRQLDGTIVEGAAILQQQFFQKHKLKD